MHKSILAIKIGSIHFTFLSSYPQAFTEKFIQPRNATNLGAETVFNSALLVD